MLTIGLTHYLVVAAVLFCAGLFVMMTKRNAIGILIGVELVLNSTGLNLIAFDRYVGQGRVDGQIMALFVIVLAAAEAAMAVGIPAIGEQIDDGTIVFTWTRPVKRRAIYLGRLLAAQFVATTVMSGSLILCFLIMVSNGLEVITWDFLKLYMLTFVIIAVGSFTYCALFAAAGAFFKKPVLPVILFTFGWESMVTNIPARVQELGLRFHLQNLIERPATTPDDLPGILSAILTQIVHRDPVPKIQSLGVLMVVAVVSTLIGIWILRNKEISN